MNCSSRAKSFGICGSPWWTDCKKGATLEFHLMEKQAHASEPLCHDFSVLRQTLPITDMSRERQISD